MISRTADLKVFPLSDTTKQGSAAMGRESSKTSQECGSCKAGYEIQINSSGNTTSVEADPHFLLRARMIFDIERSRKINSSIGKW